MDYKNTYQNILSAVMNKGDVLLSHPSHYVSIASNSPSCRSIWWKFLLGVLPKDPSQWEAVVRQQRQSYDELRVKLSVTPGITEETEDLSLNNPLSQDTHSSWNQYFEDSEMKRLIRQDVERTFPEERFFHLPVIQEMMVAIIFCYSKEHPDVGFKQGLHEVLAPLLQVLDSDYRQYGQQQHAHPSLPVLDLLMDLAYLEHDAYCLLCGMMQRLSKWYVSRDPPPAPDLQQPLLQQPLLQQPFSDPVPVVPSPGEVSPLQARIELIHQQLLPALLPALALHLTRLDISPQVYAIRWLRLLFGREFSLAQLPLVWDAVFWCASCDDFPLADHIAIALLDTIKTQLLCGDYLTCLNLLMRFPHPADVTALLATALQQHIVHLQQVRRVTHLLFTLTDVFVDAFGSFKFSSVDGPADAGRQLQPLRPAPPHANGAAVGTSSPRLQEARLVLQEDSLLQQMADALSHHLTALGRRHLQLSVHTDGDVRAAMDSLLQVSRRLQEAARGEALSHEAASLKSLPPTRSHPLEHSPTRSHPLEHPLQGSPN
ncbi:TBC1 domain family member 5 [Hyalella azteca]|uniref:TBC1 domain family member 5 n=1 Tax=Hyalella azteca TaxID=294128 RepID=A0A979FSU2_HYAAZ|nr:TBC1 domain family member 5 [Hyalella azteca]